jgi:general secretion pathway protein E
LQGIIIVVSQVDGKSKSKKSADRPLELPSLLLRLIADERLSQKDADNLLVLRRTQQQIELHPLTFIAEQSLADQKNPGKVLDEEALANWLAQSVGQPYYRIDPLKINVGAITDTMSFAFSERHQILALEVNSGEVVITTAQPNVTSWEENIEHVMRRPIKRVISNPSEIRRRIVEFYSLAKSISRANTNSGPSSPNLANFEQLLQLGAAESPEANDQGIINIVDWLFNYAFEQRASDIHIEPRRDLGHIRFRIDGVLHTVYEMPTSVMAAVTSRLKILGRMNIAEKRKPQDGRVKTKTPTGKEIELRLSTMPTAFGEKLVMRIFDPDVLIKGFSELGFAKEDAARWNTMTTKPHGIVLVTGPTGSGKTTTLYSTLKQLATPEVNVCTVEDPIEMVEPAFNQMQVQHNIDLTFANGMRTLLRQDPDIIMVGEIRDLETAEMAIQASLTGHLVLSTLHTNDAPSAITRLIELGIPPYLIRSTVLGVMAQRLVRILCPHCKQPTQISEQDWKALTQPWNTTLPKQAHKTGGCLECRTTGYFGRMGVYEVMMMSETMRELVTDKCEVDQLRKQAFKEGMHTLRISGAQKVASGLTTIEEVLRVTPASTN